MPVETNHVEYDANASTWQRIRDAIAGQETMQRRAINYIVRPTGMTDNAEWAEYVKNTEFYDATSRTVDGLTGMPFATPPVVKVPEAMKAIREDMTMDGLSIEGFAEKLFDEVLIAGRSGVLVDHPEPDPTIRTRRDEEVNHRRPYARIYSAESIFNWAVKNVNGRPQLVQVRLLEKEPVEGKDEFDHDFQDIIRVLELEIKGKVQTYLQRVFKKNGKGNWYEPSAPITPLMNGKPLPYIPFWFVNPRDLTPSTVKPPLLGLANANIAHFKTTAKYENVLSFCGSPQPYITGYKASDGDEFSIGSSEAWTFEGSDTKLGYLTIGTEGLDALVKRLDGLENQMAMMGARMLSPDSKGVEAAETAQIHRQGEVSVLSGICNTVSKALSEVLRVMAEWHGITAASEDLTVVINTEFFQTIMTGSEAVALMALWQSGTIAYADFLTLLKRGKLVDPERTEEAIAAENQSGVIQPATRLLADPAKV
jgi:Domain of unknown function (DUF4055)